MMTSCDLSDQTKPWEGAYKVSGLLYAEFFNQGDMVSIVLDFPILTKGIFLTL